MAAGIIGGNGGIGRLFGRLLTEAGAAVLVAVPLRATPAVLAEVASHVRPGSALVSLGSLMEPALDALRDCRAGWLLLHPLFGPGRRGLHGASLALVVPETVRGFSPTGTPSDAPGPPGPPEWLLSVLRAGGATIVETTPEAHDRTMAVAQALLHGSGAALAPLLTEPLSGSGSDPWAWMSPTLRLYLALTARILHQDPALYGDLLALNRHTPAAIDALIARLDGLRTAVAQGPDATAAYFTAARDALGTPGVALAAHGDTVLGEGQDEVGG